MINFHVDQNKCVHCDACVADCPVGIIKMAEDNFPGITKEERCLRCQHCLAVCPTGAISILGRKPENSLPVPEKNEENSQWLKGLIRGRRSVRQYMQEDLTSEEVSELLNTAWHAPTGHNDQTVRFSVVHGQEAMKAMKEEVYSSLAEVVGDLPRKSDPRFAMLGWAVSRWKKGMDVIFRDAPNLLLAHAPKDATTPLEDCLIAMTTFELAAQAAGLGTLWIGMGKWAIGDICPGIKEKLGIPEDHVLGYAMIFGKPAVKYHRSVDRTPAPIHWVTSSK